ncbi:MAG: hypothetical protein CVU81_01725 [Euryarchaeota archaeon HGW-Euryarchaeota-1]|nr:MAG: hypothetical protein CVU81_01725 [Euryarchaeota archaeon HGW-Euryarchaeota-1]
MDFAKNFEYVLGREKKGVDKYGKVGCAYLGKTIVQMGATYSLTNDIFMDLAAPHVVLVCGKRGSGKSYTLSVIAEEITLFSKQVGKHVGGIMFDTMGIFWSMQFPNLQDAGLVKSSGLQPQGVPVNLFISETAVEKYNALGIKYKGIIKLAVNGLSAIDWALTFNLDLNSGEGILMQRVLTDLNEKKKNFDLDDVVVAIEKTKVDEKAKTLLVNLFEGAKGWGLFGKIGTPIDEIIKLGEVAVVDVSTFEFLYGWSVRALVVGLLLRKIFDTRMTSRKIDESEQMSYFLPNMKPPTTERVKYLPQVVALIDEVHEFIASDMETPATKPLLQWIREGRQPGLTLIMATQEPGVLSPTVLSQVDIVISHLLTSKKDIDALRSVAQTYVHYDITEYFSLLPKVKGVCLVLDDNSEKLYTLRVRPKLSWHAGASPNILDKEMNKDKFA